MKECKDMCYKDLLVCLIGNKIDLEDKRQVSYEDGKKFAEENDMLFFETSAKEGNNIQEIFSESVSILVEKKKKKEIKLETSNTGIKIDNSEDDDKEFVIKLKNKSKCC